MEAFRHNQESAQRSRAFAFTQYIVRAICLSGFVFLRLFLIQAWDRSRL